MTHGKRIGYLVAALLAVALIATSAQADILPLLGDAAVPPAGEYIMPGLGNPTSELNWVRTTTGNPDLDLFQKSEKSCNTPGCSPDELFTSESITVDRTDPQYWHLTWDTDIWNVKWILVKDGADSGPGGCQDDCLYMLFQVTEAQWQDGDGYIYVPADASRSISHFTAFGEKAPVSEPVTLALLGVGLLGTMVLGRRLQS
jgi:hypothetical protein